MNSYKKLGSYNPKDITSWIIFAFLVIVLSGLLLLKVSGRQNIFSYQGIRNNTAGFGYYKSGIQAINTYLNTSLDSHGLQLDEGIGSLKKAVEQAKDKTLIELLSGELENAQNIKILGDVSYCMDILISGYNTIGNIKSEYNAIVNGYNQTKVSFKERINILPEGETKSCLTSYLKGLETSIEALVLTHNNIQNIETEYGVVFSEYKESEKSCMGIEQATQELTDMYKQMNKVKTIINQVNEKLKTENLEQLSELCDYGQIQGLTGLQTMSWNAVQKMKDAKSSLIEVQDIKEYVQGLVNKSIVSSGENKQTRYQNLVNKILK